MTLLNHKWFLVLGIKTGKPKKGLVKIEGLSKVTHSLVLL